MPDTQDTFSLLGSDGNRERELNTLIGLSDKFGNSLSRAFAKTVVDGRSFDDTLKSIGRSLVEIGLKAALMPLQNLFQQGLQGLAGSGGGSLFEGLLGGAKPFAQGGVFSRGMVMPFAAGGVVGAPTYFPMERGLGLMGERGSEAIMPLARGADGRLGVRTAGGASKPMNVTVNIATSDAESFRRSEAQVSAALARAVARGQRGL